MVNFLYSVVSMMRFPHQMDLSVVAASRAHARGSARERHSLRHVDLLERGCVCVRGGGEGGLCCVLEQAHRCSSDFNESGLPNAPPPPTDYTLKAVSQSGYLVCLLFFCFWYFRCLYFCFWCVVVLRSLFLPRPSPHIHTLAPLLWPLY